MPLATREGQSDLRYWLRFGGGTEALASCGHRGGPVLPVEYLRFITGCRDHFETVRHIFVHACYVPD
jgi:hypothetical protein